MTASAKARTSNGAPAPATVPGPAAGANRGRRRPRPPCRPGPRSCARRCSSASKQVVLATMALPRHRHQTVADLSHPFLAPLLRDRVAIAHKAARAPDGTAAPGEETVVGIALWATVSDAVDAAITEQVKAGVFPVRLGPDDWASGETVWLLDVVAADRAQATSLLANFRQVAGGRPVKIARRDGVAAGRGGRRPGAGDVAAGELPAGGRRAPGEDRTAGHAADRARGLGAAACGGRAGPAGGRGYGVSCATRDGVSQFGQPICMPSAVHHTRG